ncbi:MAG: fumarylacetoacetate hydrolase family protein [Alphaproteobacteria bacterium]|nr:fumarylacetoacetate hydrolase family protein [Alphaproteobacteria bacterium]
MTDEEIAAAAALLVQARRSGEQIEALPVMPSSIAEAHAIQDRVAATLGETVGAFKAAAPAGGEPMRGLIFARMIRSSPARMSPGEVPHLGVEGEVAFRFTRALPARSAPYTREEVSQAIVALPAIEVVSARFRDATGRPRLEQLADCIANGGLVPGTELRDWQKLDMTHLHVKLLVNGEPVVDQQGGHPTGDPLGAAVALVNMMRSADGVTAGQIVTAGSWTGLRFLKPGDACRVEFESLGVAEVAFDS